MYNINIRNEDKNNTFLGEIKMKTNVLVIEKSSNLYNKLVVGDIITKNDLNVGLENHYRITNCRKDGLYGVKVKHTSDGYEDIN